MSCIEWRGYTAKNGYGRLYGFWVHRLAYELYNGPIPKGHHVDHRCRNKLCINPSHLEAVTAAENARRAAAVRRAATHCRNGHPYAERGGVVMRKRNGKVQAERYCLECNRLSARRARKRKEGGSDV